MQKRPIQLLLLLLTLIFGSVAPAWAGAGSQEAGRLTWGDSRSSLDLIDSKSFKQVGLVEIDLSVEGEHCYFVKVAGQAVVVHNKKCSRKDTVTHQHYFIYGVVTNKAIPNGHRGSPKNYFSGDTIYVGQTYKTRYPIRKEEHYNHPNKRHWRGDVDFKILDSSPHAGWTQFQADAAEQKQITRFKRIGQAYENARNEMTNDSWNTNSPLHPPMPFPF